MRSAPAFSPSLQRNVITPADRKIFVWRGVPSIADSVLTAPYQLDGRQATLESQAQGAITSHSEGVAVPASELTRIAEFQRTTFTAERVRDLANLLASGADPNQLPDVEGELELTAQEMRGQDIFNAVCAACHGGPNKATIVNREVHALAFPALKADGTVLYEVPVTDPPTPVLAAQPENEFLNIGTAYQAMQGQFDPDSSSFTKDVSFPNYRYRFYTDSSRTEIAADLPPAAPPVDGDGFDGTGGGDDIADALFGEFDSDGNPVTGPNLAIQFFSTDPGRAMITGSPNDFEAFDVPTLRGIGRTAPYFHNNTAESLEKVVDLYSDHLLSRFPSLTLPGEKEADADGDIGPPEALTRQQKDDLIAFLKRL